MKHSLWNVTDHAVIRYLERVKGVDVDEVRREILEKVDQALEMGACGAVVEGHRYKIADGQVVTVLDANRPDIRTGCAKGKRGAIDDG